MAKTWKEISNKDEIITLGDANAQIGKELYLKKMVDDRKGTIDDAANGNRHRLCQPAGSLNMTFLTTKSTK